MLKMRSHWTCNDCLSPSLDPGSPAEAQDVPQETAGTGKMIQVLNLYAGIGGNRKYWDGVQVTAVERDLKVAAAYKSLYPNDILIIADAHHYLLKNYSKFDIIWASYPCQTHSRMNYWLTSDKKRYADLRIYSEILLLQNFFKGVWVYENIDTYYTPLVTPSIKIGRHLFWSNIKLTPFKAPELYKDRGINIIDLQTTKDKELIMEWLGIRYEKNLYLSGKDYIQVFRNCVHPDIGKHIFEDIKRHLYISSVKPLFIHNGYSSV